MRPLAITSLTVLVSLASSYACNSETQWRQVDSANGLFAFQYPDGWIVEPSENATIVTYRNPKSGGELTVSGYFGIESGEDLANISWHAVAGDKEPLPKWKRTDGVGWHSWRQRFVADDKATEVLVIWGNERSAVATLQDSVGDFDDNQEVYEHMLSSVRIDPFAKPTKATAK